MPRRHQAYFKVIGLILFEDITYIDDKGDIANPFPHLYVDFRYNGSPMARTRRMLEWQQNTIDVREDTKRDKVFPKSIKPFALGDVFEDHQVTLPPDDLSLFRRNPSHFTTLFDVDDKYSFLKARDVIFVTEGESNTGKIYLEVTHDYRSTVKKYVSTVPGALPKSYIERQVGRVVTDSEKLHIFEVQVVYDWALKRRQEEET